MSPAQLQTRERNLEVSAEALSKICPESTMISAPREGSRPGRGWTGLRVRLRLLCMRARFRIGDLQAIRCGLVRWRLRTKLACLRLRHGRRLK